MPSPRLLLCWSLALGCGLSEPTPRPAPAARDSAQPGKPSTKVTFASASTQMQRGQAAVAHVKVTTADPWHLNLEFPAAVRLSASPGVRLPAGSEKLTTAERFDADGLVFAVPYTVDGCGPQTISAQVDFAVCADNACAPQHEKVSLDLAAC
jgi:hypothetical protein